MASSELLEFRKTLSSSLDKLERVSSFHERLEFLVFCAGGPNPFSRLTGLSISGIKRYLSGGEPTISKLAQIADSLEVSFLWIGTGEGVAFKGDNANLYETSGRVGTRPEVTKAQASKAEALVTKKAKKLGLNLDNTLTTSLKEILLKGVFDEEALVKVLQSIKHLQESTKRSEQQAIPGDLNLDLLKLCWEIGEEMVQARNKVASGIEMLEIVAIIYEFAQIEIKEEGKVSAKKIRQLAKPMLRLVN